MYLVVLFTGTLVCTLRNNDVHTLLIIMWHIISKEVLQTNNNHNRNNHQAIIQDKQT